MQIEQKKGLFKWISILEGISFLVLLFLAMPLKYFFDNPEPVRYVGMAHGILFIAYVVGALLLYNAMQWRIKDLAFILLFSLVPFGPFYVEKKYL
ncbi:DUF3817 domain-containing protein [Autumnicola musiva]|uniref:DUF3817 domain-containing protein n=1 Tax=Autumnicola musiva TaxID=3075589 RepID=A0ABU3D5U6_9FLAO|nr:DUF3817 domain-containing protein [Zunongwangia sp. F117]MDT0676907.1 DUF3817 domain-containing protein [Zunongwangia sp. F117]